MVAAGDVLEVIGGSDKGGIIVRSGQDTSSQATLDRLATGALVRVLGSDEAGGRLMYRLLHGEGPQEGWVSLKAKGKDLLTSVGAQLKQEMGIDVTDESLVAKRDEISVLKQDLPVKALKVALDESNSEEDSGEDQATLCTQCRLPLGEQAYTVGKSGKRFVHGECMAQLMLHNLKEKETARQRLESQRKAEQRAEFQIGWSAQRIPCNVGTAETLGCDSMTQHMCSLRLDEGTRTVSVVATQDPASAVNLEYLAVALAVRRQEGREPRFSLDPVEGQSPSGIDDESLLQVKRFEPPWLAGTAVGEVLFQSDYYLKELSMGEYHQPVIGMKSCFDFSTDEGCDKPWSAREWFFVRKAEVQLSDDSRLVPCLSMGVEAREQVRGSVGLEDARITRPDHPLVKYAEEFTRNFDLIAERRSVIFHLRELAKASVLAKFLGEAEINLDDRWFDFTADVQEPLHLEIPQLWNRRLQSQVQVEDGLIVDPKKGVHNCMHGVYGGVDFGLDRFSLGRVAPGRRAAPPLAERRVVTLGAYQPTRAWGGEAKTTLVRKDRFPQAAMPRPRVPKRLETRGVDLSLDEFELAEARRTSTQTCAGSWGRSPPGGAFLQLIDSHASEEERDLIAAEDLQLLREIFNPRLSDRRDDGECFVPPDASFSYVSKLRDLLKQESLVLDQRTQHFLSSEFAVGRAGPLFPWTWTSAFELAHSGPLAAAAAEMGARPEGGWLEEKPELRDEVVIGHVLNTLTPVFDKDTEDGVSFRIYRFGTLEVRTLKDQDGVEEIGAVFSVRRPAQRERADAEQGQGQAVARDARIVKVTELVERAHRRSMAVAEATQEMSTFCRRYFVLFETAEGDAIVTERLADGRVTWEERPAGLDDRRALARVLRSADCSKAGISVGDLVALHMREAPPSSSPSAPCGAAKRKDFARAAYGWAFGQAGPPRRAVAVLKSAQAGANASRTRGGRAQHAQLAWDAGRVRGQKVQSNRASAQNNVFQGLFAD